MYQNDNIFDLKFATSFLEPLNIYLLTYLLHGVESFLSS